MTIQEYFQQHPKVALAFSGGVDSAYLLYAALACKAQVVAYFVKSAFQPQFELEDAQRLAGQLGAQLRVMHVDILADGQVAANPPQRCYHCKRAIFAEILKAAEADGYSVVMDGTNASDDVQDRPGMRALGELHVHSPLRMCGITKDEIRRRSRQAQLFTWDKPAYACLATRIPTGDAITQEKLEQTERGESHLFSLGFTDFRIRMLHGCARVQLPPQQLSLALERRQEILDGLKPYYSAVLLDLEVRE